MKIQSTAEMIGVLIMFWTGYFYGSHRDWKLGLFLTAVLLILSLFIKNEKGGKA